VTDYSQTETGPARLSPIAIPRKIRIVLPIQNILLVFGQRRTIGVHRSGVGGGRRLVRVGCAGGSSSRSRASSIGDIAGLVGGRAADVLFDMMKYEWSK
jgi:hypothetical protein